MSAPLRSFRETATPEEALALAQAVGTTEEYLFSHLGRHRGFSISKAAAVEDFTTALSEENNGRTPKIVRAELCADCARCPYANPAPDGPF